MLKNIDPLISPELLGILARMGHGDTIAVVDQNFPAYTPGVPVVRADGVNSTVLARAVFRLLPIDTYIDQPIVRMIPDSREQELHAVQEEFLAEAERAEQRTIDFGVIDRLGFYQLARSAAAVIVTGENRPWGCFLVTKGVIHDL